VEDRKRGDEEAMPPAKQSKPPALNLGYLHEKLENAVHSLAVGDEPLCVRLVNARSRLATIIAHGLDAFGLAKIPPDKRALWDGIVRRPKTINALSNADAREMGEAILSLHEWTCRQPGPV
jgi:hypothetical protein